MAKSVYVYTNKLKRWLSSRTPPTGAAAAFEVKTDNNLSWKAAKYTEPTPDPDPPEGP